MMSFLKSTLLIVGIVGGTSFLIWLGVHFGSKWIDRMLCVPPKRDPSQPIVLPHLEDRETKR